MNYNSIFSSSTSAFRSKHLISDEEIRQKLLEICENELGKRNQCNIDVTDVNALYDTVCDACAGTLAETRLLSLLKYGCFRVGESNYVGYRSTLIISETIVLHMQRSVTPGYLHFEIEKKASLTPHLSRNRYGQIFHYKRLK